MKKNRTLSPILLALIFFLSACTDSSRTDNRSQNKTPTSQSPVATDVSIIDNNAGHALIGDTLTGSYRYSDANDDKQGQSLFRWLRGEQAIAGATGLSYTVNTEDRGHTLRFEVTPVAASGEKQGKAVISAPITVFSTSSLIAEGSAVTVNMDEDSQPTAFKLTLNATGQDESDTLTWSLHKPPAHGTATASAKGATLPVTYQPGANYYGTDSFIVQLTDHTGGVDTITVNVTIKPVNDAPVISGLSALQVSETQPLHFVPVISDVDHSDKHTFTIINKPAWATFNPRTGALTGTAGHANVGDYHAIGISVTDTGVGNLTDTLTFSIKVVDDVAPVIHNSNTIPRHNAINALPDHAVSAVFSEALASASINSNTFTLTHANGDPVNGTVALTGVDQNTVTFIPSARLTPATQYTATLTTDITDVAGNALASPVRWQFTTVPAVEALYPRAPQWNDYVSVRGFKTFRLPCDIKQRGGYSTCIHGGEKRSVEVTGYRSCANLTATDALGAFNWRCDDSFDPVRMISTGLKPGKNLSDLLNFATASWHDNAVIVMDDAGILLTTSAGPWWENPVVIANQGGSLSREGAIYIVTTNTSANYSLTQNKIAFVVEPGVTVSSAPGSFSTSLINAKDNAFLWLEGTFSPLRSSSGIVWSGVNFSVIRNTGIQGGHHGIYLSQSDNNNLIAIRAADNQMNGIFIESAAYNGLSDITVFNARKGILVEFSTAIMISNAIATNSATTGIEFSNSNNNTVMNLTAANNQNGIIVSLTNYNTLTNIALAGNHKGFVINNGTNNTFSNLIVTNHSSSGLEFYSTSDNTLTGLLAVGNNHTSNCYIWSGNNPGLENDTCQNNGSSDAILRTGITQSHSLVGKIETDDAINSSDNNGAANNTDTLNWLSFETPYRTWSKEGPLFSSNTRGQWTSGPGHIFDWSLRASDLINRSSLTKHWAGDTTSTITHTWANGAQTTYLRNATELHGDGIGNDNSLCESNETCFYTPNMGRYQGHGSLISAGVFSHGDGTITNVTLLEFSINGY